MTARFSTWLFLLAVLIPAAYAKDKSKGQLSQDIVQARTVFVVIRPETGEPLDNPTANATARDNVEKALMEWGRFQVVMDQGLADLVITVRTGTRLGQPTVRGGGIDTRPTITQSTDSSTRIGVQQGRPGMNDPMNNDPMNTGPHMGSEIGPSDDMMEVFRGNLSDPPNAPPVWRYIAKDCLRAPGVTAVEQFRKAIANAEKAQQQKKP